MSPTAPNRPRRTLGLAVCCLLCVAAFSGAATAHAGLEEATPGDGERVGTVPESLELVFAGDGVQSAAVEVTGPDGDRVDGDAAVDGEAGVVSVPLEESGEGVYTVRWEVLSSDGHEVTGTYFFVVGDEELDRERILEARDDGDDEGVPYAESATKGLLLVGVMGLLGVPVTLAAVVSPATRRFGVTSAVGARRARRLVAGAALATFLAAALLGAVRLRAVPGGPLGSLATFLGGSLGRAWLVQFALAGATVAAVLEGLRSDAPRRWTGAAFAGGFAVACTVAWTSHSATLVGRLRGLLVDLGHVFGAAAWVGGLLVLGVVVPPYLRAADADRAPRVAARATALFSVVALAGVVVALVTGLALAAWHVPDLAALWETAYGGLLSAKVALVLLALGLGGFNRLVLLRRLDPSAWEPPIPGLDRPEASRADGGVGGAESVARFVRSVQFEAAVLVAVVLLTGALTSAPTAAVAGSDSGTGVLSAETGDFEVVVEPVPSRTADGAVVVAANDPVVFDVGLRSDGGPADAEEATLFLRSDESGTTLEAALDRVEPGTYSSVQAVPAGGEWELRVEAVVDGKRLNEWFTLQVDDGAGGTEDAPAADERAAVGAGGPFGTVALLLALLVGVVGSVVAVGEARRTAFPGAVREEGGVEGFAAGPGRTPSGRPLQPDVPGRWTDAARAAGRRLASEATRAGTVAAGAVSSTVVGLGRTDRGRRAAGSATDGDRVVDVARGLEVGDRVRLERAGREWAVPLEVVDAEVTEWVDGDGSRRFETARVRLTSGHAGTGDHVVEATTGGSEPPTWRRGSRRVPVTRLEPLEE